MFNQPILASSGQEESGVINLSAQINVPESGADVTIVVYGGFGTTLGHTAAGYNVGNANVKVELYLDGNLLPDNYIGANYSQFAITIFISAPECGEPIVECTDFETPKIDESNIEVIGPNENWQWIDSEGNLHNVNTGTDCDKLGEDTLGVTTIPLNFPMGSDTGYQRFEDIKPEVCLDKSDPNNAKWQFHLNDIRVPIFTSVCDREGWIDLRDGTDDNLLNQHIKNCDDLFWVIYLLNKFWIAGPHNPEHEQFFSDIKYRFNPGISKHEEYHVNSFKNISIRIINNILEGIKDSSNYLQEDYPCPEDVKNSEENNIVINFRRNFIRQLNKWGEANTQEETNADLNTRPVYEAIKQNIRNWAEMQSWYNPDDVFCSGIFED